MAQDALTVWTYRRDWSAWNLKIMMPSMAAGHRGAVAVRGLAWPPRISGWRSGSSPALSCCGTGSANALRAAGAAAHAFTGVLFGVIGGFTTMLANAGGPAWQIHLLPQRLDKLTYVGTFTLLFAASNVMKVPAYGALGQLTSENLMFGAVLVPAAVITNYVGIWLVRRTSTELFFRIAYVLMFLISVELIRSALIEMSWH